MGVQSGSVRESMRCFVFLGTEWSSGPGLGFGRFCFALFASAFLSEGSSGLIVRGFGRNV